jgi:hypothetical protein
MKEMPILKIRKERIWLYLSVVYRLVEWESRITGSVKHINQKVAVRPAKSSCADRSYSVMCTIY